MKNTTKVEAKKILTPKQFLAFEENFDVLMNELQKTGTIQINSFVPVLGRIPVIPQSPFMDVMLDGWNDQFEYTNKVNQLRDLITSEI